MSRLKQITEDALRAAAREHQRHLFAGDGLTLLRVAFDNPYIQMLWREHYVGSRGTVGRQLHYIVYYNGLAVGGISAGSAIFAHKKRDAVLEVTAEEKRTGLRNIVNNTMFRLTRPKNCPPLATEVLSVFREVVSADWHASYGDAVRAFETLVEPPRWGGIYKLDGWTRVGWTAGLGARRPEGHGTAGKNSTGVRKIVRVPRKILWVLPVRTLVQATALSEGRNSFGDDSALVMKALECAQGRPMKAHELAEKSGVSRDRITTILYMLSHGEEARVRKAGSAGFALISGDA